jgi:hypothetical protein
MDAKNPDEENLSPEPEKVPLEPYLEKLTDLLQLVVENMDQRVEGNLPVDLDEKLAKLEGEVKEFCKFNEGMSSFLTENAVINPFKPLPKGLDRIIKRGKKLQVEGEEKLELLMQQQGRILSSDQKQEKKFTSEERSAANRKKKFKRIGQKKV